MKKLEALKPKASEAKSEAADLEVVDSEFKFLNKDIVVVAEAAGQHKYGREATCAQWCQKSGMYQAFTTQGTFSVKPEHCELL